MAWVAGQVCDVLLGAARFHIAILIGDADDRS